MPPILNNKNPSAASVFRPTALLREARRQKGLPSIDVPSVCILDPDGDLVRRLRQDGRAQPFEGWPCYHTQLDTFALGAGRSALWAVRSAPRLLFLLRKSFSRADADSC